MRYALYRLTAPILDRIPDISHQPQSRQVSIGILASLLVHFFLLLFALVVGLILPHRSPLQFAKAKPKLQEIELMVIPPQDAPRLVPLEEIEHPRPFLDSRGLAPSDTAPDKAIFESDVNMIAASEAPARGASPLPSQDGRIAPEFPEFSNQHMSLGKNAAPFPQDLSLTPPPPPVAKPEPQTQNAPPPEKADAQAAEKPSPPTPLKEVAQPADDEIALAAKLANAAPAAPPLPKPRMRTTMPVAMLATPVPQARTKSGYQPQQEKTRIEGNISNRGRNAVDAVGTPLGRYQKAVREAIGSRWYFYIADKMSVIAPGQLKVSFSIDREGRVGGLRIEANTSNATFAEVCERAVRDSEFAPPPPDLFEPLAGGQLDITFTFDFNTF